MGKKCFSSPKRSNQFWGSPKLQWPPGRFSPGVKRPGLEVDNVYPSGVEVQDEWSYTSTPSIYLHGVVRNSFIFHVYHKTHVML